MALTILGISGSLRTDSYNRKALQVAKKMAAAEGAAVTELDLRDLDLPMYDGDIETKGLPESVQKLKKAIESADILLLASPEYNFSVSGALKNAIDWASRGGNSLDGKWVIIFGVSNGAYGTIRGQSHLRQILQQLGVYMIPLPVVYIGPGGEAFSEGGSLKEPKIQEKLQKLITKTIEIVSKLKE